MRIYLLFATLVLIAISVNAKSPQRQVLITYPDETPDSTLSEAKIAIETAGGRVLHEFEILKGFIVKASTRVLDTIHTLSDEFKPLIEEDTTVTTQGAAD